MLDAINAFDFNILTSISNLHCAFLDAFFSVYTSFGNAGAVCIALAILFMAIKKTRRIGFACSLSLIYDLILCNLILKPLLARPRPYDFYEGFSSEALIIKAPTDFSFPSGHTAACFAFSTALFMYNKKWGILAFALSALMGFSRLYLGVHYPTDVFGGVIIGVVCGVLAYFSIKYIYHCLSKKNKDTTVKQEN